MEDVIEIIDNISGGLECKITISKEQKKVLDNFVITYMESVSNPFIKDSNMQQVVIQNLDEKWENLFEVVE